jgi:hypothetical protein
MGEVQATWTGVRRATRYYFGGVAELIDEQTGKYVVAETGQLSRFGCFVKQITPFSRDSTIVIRITHQGASFAAGAKVVYVLDSGMGIAFDSVSPENEVILNEWLALCAQRVIA